MEKALVQISLFGLLLALVTTLPNKDDWNIYSFHINSTVNSRYAKTVITSRVANRMDESKEIEFHVRIPKNAFISKFKMLIDGQEYDGVVKAKEQAQQQYTEAVLRGQSAGIVSSVGRTLEEFKTSVTVAGHKKVTFELTYEELLKRRLGKYELQIHARPMQPVKDFKVDVYINEKAGIKFIEVKGGLSTGSLANAITKTKTEKQAWLYFYPTEDQQKTCGSCGDQGLNGDLIVAYDVNRDSSLGDIKQSDGYFVHHFAPSSLPRIPKNVVFVIDQSGSMYGRKIEQTRLALLRILNDLAEDDFFGIITFDSGIFYWKRELLGATEQNLGSAKEFARQIKDRGATDINNAVLAGASMLNAHPREGSASILILLTDGDPTSGITNREQIQSNVRRAIVGKFPLYCLGFGYDVDFEFLEKMSLQNNGVARRIYEDSDADLQLQGFYEEVATPLLTDVTMIYIGGDNLTQTNFSQYYNGSEIVVAGQITDNNIETFSPQVVAISNNRRIVFHETNATVEANGTEPDFHIQRVWAYLTVKQLLEKELQLSGSEKKDAKQEALRLSLKYSFVTPLTSMVVTKPQGETTDVLHKPKEGEAPDRGLARLGHHPGGYPGQSGIIPRGNPGLPGNPGNGGHHSQFKRRYHSSPSSPSSSFPQFFGGGGFGTGVALGSVPRGGAGLGRGRGGGGGGGGGAASATDTFLFSGGVKYALPEATEAEDAMEYDLIEPSYVVLHEQMENVSPPLHRFLRKTENQSLPLCFDVGGGSFIKLLHHPNRELSVNGELYPAANGGFSRIVIHFRNARVEIGPHVVSVRDGRRETIYTPQDFTVTIESMTLIRRGKEIEVAIEDTRLVVLLHMRRINAFLWPVLRQPPPQNNVTGILAVKPAVYEDVQQNPPAKLKINNHDVSITRSTAVDFSIISGPILDCWLTTAESALQSSLNTFTVTQL